MENKILGMITTDHHPRHINKEDIEFNTIKEYHLLYHIDRFEPLGLKAQYIMKAIYVKIKFTVDPEETVTMHFYHGSDPFYVTTPWIDYGVSWCLRRLV